ncbi:hypothetical protein BU25DRAFT_467371, partial [Macroventuria anomochaeta]
HHQLSAREVAEHQSISKRCAASAGAFTVARKQRSLAKHNALVTKDTNVTIHTSFPFYDTIQNDTCILIPEVTAGPYVWPQSDTLRQDMSEGQADVPIYLNIGVLNTNTCEPAPNVLIDLWHCNATGSYSSFEALSPNSPFEQPFEQLNVTIGAGTLDLHRQKYLPTRNVTHRRQQCDGDEDCLPGFLHRAHDSRSRPFAHKLDRPRQRHYRV